MAANWLDKYRKRALRLLDRLPHPKYGVRLDLNCLKYEAEKSVSLTELPSEARRALNELAFSSARRSVLAVQVDAARIYRESLNLKGVVVEDTETAAVKYPWVRDYWFKAVPLGLNKLTALHAAYWRGGFVLRVAENVKLTVPIQICFIVSSSRRAQMPHSVVVAEPGSEVHILSGCTAPLAVSGSVHIGLTEIYVKKGARVVSTMIEYWPHETHSRPIKGVIVEEGGEYVENLVILRPGSSLQAYPTVVLRGRRASTVMRAIGVATGRSDVDLGEAAYLLGEESSARLINRMVAKDEVRVKQRSKAWGRARGSRAYVECSGIILGEKASLATYPSLVADHSDAELYHESAVGRVAEDQLVYLMSRGFTEEEAIALIVNGFLDPGILDLPEPVKKQVSEALARMI